MKTKYPKLVSKNKALCKAISLLPVTTKSSIPAVYVRSLPMVIGVVTVLLLLVIPVSRQATFNFVKESSVHFSEKNNELKSNLAFSLRAGVTAYSNQIRDNIKILPIDTQVEPRQYGGRNTTVKKVVFSETSHLVTATVFKAFSGF